MNILKPIGEFMLIPLPPIVLFLVGILLLRQNKKKLDNVYLIMGVLCVVAGFVSPFYTMWKNIHTHVAWAIIVGVIICIITLGIYVFFVVVAFVRDETPTNRTSGHIVVVIRL